jgi:hypothetical protein
MAEEKNIQSGTREVTQEGERILNDIKSRGRSLLSEEKQMVADKLGIFANALRKSEQYLRDQNQFASAGLVGQVSAEVGKIAGKMRDRDIDALAEEVRRMAREKPQTFFGIAIASGFVLSRFFKGSATALKEESFPSSEKSQEYASSEVIPEMEREEEYSMEGMEQGEYPPEEGMVQEDYPPLEGIGQEEYPPMESGGREVDEDIGPESQGTIIGRESEEKKKKKD